MSSQRTPVRRVEVAGLILIAVATIIAYWPALGGGMLWDDDAHITRPALQSCEGLYRIWFDLGATQQYYPLLHTAFWLEHWAWGDSVVGYHVVNLVWHILSAVLLFLILRRLGIAGALLAAAIFALHPVMVESVAWISEQKNTLSAVFYLSALLAYLGFDEKRGRGRYVFALVLFVLGLLTKTVTATLPAVALVIFWWQRGSINWRRDVLPLVPFFALGAIAGVTTAWVERTLIGAEGADFALTFGQRVLLAGRAVWFYFGKLFWPAGLTFIYPRWEIDAGVWWQWLYPLAALLVTGSLVVVARFARGPLAGWLIFCGTLFPVLGFLNVYPFVFSYVADHFQYLASLGVIVAVSGGVAAGLSRVSRGVRRVGYGGCGLLVGVLAALTWSQAGMYASHLTLFEATLVRNPDCWMVHNNLAMILGTQNRQQEAIAHFERAIELHPKYFTAHNNLGAALTGLGKLPEAIEHYRAAIELKPDYLEAHRNLGIALMLSGRPEEALSEFGAALELSPGNPHVLNSQAVAYIKLGRFADAAESLQGVVERWPGFKDARDNLVMAFMLGGERDRAIDTLERAVAREPNDPAAHYSLAKILAESGNMEVAKQHFESAVRLRPEFAEAHNDLAELQRHRGEYAEAIGHYRAALRLKPDLWQSYANLCIALNLADRSEEAVKTAERAIETARAAKQETVASQIEDWLFHYRKELDRNREAEADGSAAAPAD